MKGFSSLSLVLLLLTTVATTHAYMDPLADGEDENGDGELDEADTIPRTLGQRCGTTNPCARNLDCIRLPIRRKCVPSVQCGKQAFLETLSQTGFDLVGYGQLLLDKAGVTQKSLMRPFPDARLNLFNQDTDDVIRVKQAIMDNPPPLELLKASFLNCTNNSGDSSDDDNDESSDESSARQSEQQNAGVTPYGGGSWEAGVAATYNGDIFYGQGTSDTTGIGILNNCFGFVLGLDAGAGGLFGLAFTDSIANLLNGCKQVIPLFSFPPFELQVGFVDTTPPIIVMEMTAGLSASTGLPGYTSCTSTRL